MLFNSQNFIFIFLPFVILLYFLSLFFIKKNENLIIYILSLSSLYFYGHWNINYIFLICLSIIFNFYLGKLILSKNKSIYFICGIIFNIFLIAYFKYFNFFIDNINNLFSSNIIIQEIELPLAISFFTFQQIAFLVDLKNRQIIPKSFLKYCFFILFFPQLIAGPIVRYQEIIPQLHLNHKKKLFLKNLTIGLSFFIIGLFKKNCIAYNLELISNSLFDNAIGSSSNFFEYWVGVVAYSFQIYFDFSAYSDMAIGLARIFGFKIPINFNSPFKSLSLIEFWTRWHITLSRIIRDLLFTPIILKLNKYEILNKFNSDINYFIQIFISAIITFAISGLWHGASWNFILWGLIHGAFIAINYFYKIFIDIRLNKFLSNFLTVFVVIIAFVPFRAENLDITIKIWKTIFGIGSDFSLNLELFSDLNIFNYLWMILSFITIFSLKNNSYFFKKNNSILCLNFNIKSSVIIFMMTLSIFLFGTDTGEEFIYFQF